MKELLDAYLDTFEPIIDICEDAKDAAADIFEELKDAVSDLIENFNSVTFKALKDAYNNYRRAKEL